MKSATGCTVITNGTVIIGTGAAAIPHSTVIVRDGKIEYVGAAAQAPPVDPAAAKIDARGGTILPGLIEAHFHPTYFNIEALEDLDIKYPVEYVTLLAACNAKLALECGYTSARSGGSRPTGMGVVARVAVASVVVVAVAVAAVVQVLS